MLLTIQIVNYNSRENLEKCLDSIQKGISKGYNPQIIVVNNESGIMDGGFGNLGDVEVVEAGKNLGFSRAHNLGAKKARGKYILFLNPDTAIFPEAIEKLIDLVGGIDVNVEESFTDEKFPLVGRENDQCAGVDPEFKCRYETILDRIQTAPELESCGRVGRGGS